MGDRCYMQVTCRPCDKERFEEIGFDVDETLDHTSTQCTMIINEANYAKHGEMPEDIPYFGYHGEGSEYGAEDYCCEGDGFISVECNKENDYVIRWDVEKDRPVDSQIQHLRRFLNVLNRVKKLFHEDPLIAEMAQAEFRSKHSEPQKQK